jgi:hypothetical protein
MHAARNDAEAIDSRNDVEPIDDCNGLEPIDAWVDERHDGARKPEGDRRMGESKRGCGTRARETGSAVFRCVVVGSLLALLCVLVVACAPRAAIETRVVPPAADFGSMRSFAIILSEDRNGNVDHVIATEIRRVLVAKGLAEADLDGADMLISYRASAVELTKSVLDGDPDANFYRIVEYVEGTLVIDVFSRSETRRIWHGQAVLDDRDPEKLAKRKTAAVDEVLAEFPPAR